MVCSAASEVFGAAWTLSAPTENAKSEEEDRQTSEPLDSLTGGVLANQRGVREGRNTVCTLFFYALSSSFPIFMLCSTGTRLVVMSVQDKLIVFVW